MNLWNGHMDLEKKSPDSFYNSFFKEFESDGPKGMKGQMYFDPIEDAVMAITEVFEADNEGAILLDPITEKTYNVIRRNIVTYISRKYNYININRVPLDFAASLEKGQLLMLTVKTETFCL